MDIDQLRQLYNTAAERLQAAARAIEHAAEDISDEDRSKLSKDFDEARDEARSRKEQLDSAEERERAVAEFTPVATGDGDPARTGDALDVRVGDEERVYRPDVRQSFFRDLAFQDRDSEAAERIGRHAAQMRDISTGTGADGVIPPVYLTELYVDLPRESRPVADVLNNGIPLPDTGMTLTIPRLASGSSVASQATENSAVSETDADTDQLTVPVRTIAGMQDVSRQAVDRTDPAFDQIIMRDLVRAYDQELDRQVIAEDGSSGQHTGLTSIASTIAVTYTDGTPTAIELTPKMNDALQQMWTNIYMPATHIIMHPRRAAWLAAATSSDSPVFPQMPVTVDGKTGGQANGFLQQLNGLPVVLSANVPTNLGVGTDEDEIYIVNANEIPLMEGPLQSAVETSPGAHTLTVRFVVYAYSAFAGNRRAKAVAKIGGTGLVAPTF